MHRHKRSKMAKAGITEDNELTNRILSNTKKKTKL